MMTKDDDGATVVMVTVVAPSSFVMLNMSTCRECSSDHLLDMSLIFHLVFRRAQVRWCRCGPQPTSREARRLRVGRIRFLASLEERSVFWQQQHQDAKFRRPQVGSRDACSLHLKPRIRG